jgi:hypothetical protein
VKYGAMWFVFGFRRRPRNGAAAPTARPKSFHAPFSLLSLFSALCCKMFDWLWTNVDPVVLTGMDSNEVLNLLMCTLAGTVMGRFIERYSVPPEEPPPPTMAERLEKAEAALLAAAPEPREMPDGTKLQMPNPEQVMAVCKHRRSIFPKDCDAGRKDLVRLLGRPDPAHSLPVALWPAALLLHAAARVPPSHCRYVRPQCPRSVLEQMCEAANWAPTHGITEPWRFVILQGEAIERLNQLKVDHAKSTMEAGAQH